jgi:ribosome-binding ATPase YchF (GTP1/OBG family)
MSGIHCRCISVLHQRPIWLATEGKEYLVRDGDVMHFRFNV